jgi:hypothetical protein
LDEVELRAVLANDLDVAGTGASIHGVLQVRIERKEHVALFAAQLDLGNAAARDCDLEAIPEELAVPSPS